LLSLCSHCAAKKKAIAERNIKQLEKLLYALKSDETDKGMLKGKDRGKETPKKSYGGVDIMSSCKQGSVLHAGVESGSVEVVQLLLQRNCSIPTLLHRENARGQNPLQLAISLKCSHEMLSLLGVVYSPHCVLQGDIASLTKLLQVVSPNAKYPAYTKVPMPLFLMACESGQAKVAKLLLASKAKHDDVVGKGLLSALHLAVVNGHTFMVDTLLKTSVGESLLAMRTAKGATALQLALRAGHADIAALLLASGSPHENLLMHASSAETAKLLLERGAVIDASVILGALAQCAIDNEASMERYRLRPCLVLVLALTTSALTGEAGWTPLCSSSIARQKWCAIK
jgi:ankyrin repeat protein